MYWLICFQATDGEDGWKEDNLPPPPLLLHGCTCFPLLLPVQLIYLSSLPAVFLFFWFAPLPLFGFCFLCPLLCVHLSADFFANEGRWSIVNGGGGAGGWMVVNEWIDSWMDDGQWDWWTDEWSKWCGKLPEWKGKGKITNQDWVEIEGESQNTS